MKVDIKHLLFQDMDRASYIQMFLFPAFFLSGMSGLMYQIVWVRMLTRYLGSTTSATAVVLCVFMGGLALGAFLGGKIADRIRIRLYGYVIIEIGIAFISLLSSFAIISNLGGIYVDFYHFFGESYIYLTSARIIFSILCLLPPTILMGATLPVLVAFITHRNFHFQYSIGRLYSVNTFGAVFGVLITGFFLIGAIGEKSSLLVAAFLNIIAAFIAFQLDLNLKKDGNISQMSSQAIEETSVPFAYPIRIRFWSRITIFASGFTALAYEILWTRLLVLPLKTSIYAFSFMLGVFLIGIAIGSWCSTRSTASKNRPVSIFAFIEVLIGFLTVAGMLVFAFCGRISKGFTTDFFLGVMTCLVMVLPVAIAFGWQFPVAVRCCISNSNVPGKETGWAYSANTIGGILGSIMAGFIFIPSIGTSMTMVILGFFNILLGCILFWVSPVRERGYLPKVAILLAVVFVAMVIKVDNPYKTIMHERAYRYLGPDAQVYAFYEGIAGTTMPAGSPKSDMARHLFVNGAGMTVLVSETKLMAHLPMVLVPDPKRVLVVCFGMGTTVRSASRFPASKIHVDAVDIVPRVFDCFNYFHADAEKVKAQKNINLYGEDGRNYLLVHNNLYDVITIDPAPPIYSAGTVNLYTREFLELCKSRINEHGVVSLWLPGGPLSEVLMIMKTFVNVFPGASLWGGFDLPGFYLIGGHQSFGQTEEDIKIVVKRLSEIPDLSEWREYYKNENMLRKLYLLGPDDFSKLVQNVSEVTDDHPYTEFPLWRGVLTHDVLVINANSIRQYLQKKKRKIVP